MAARATAPLRWTAAILKAIVMAVLVLGLVLLLVVGTVSWFKNRAERRLEERYEECLRTIPAGVDGEMECGSAGSWFG